MMQAYADYLDGLKTGGKVVTDSRINWDIWQITTMAGRARQEYIGFEKAVFGSGCSPLRSLPCRVNWTG